MKNAPAFFLQFPGQGSPYFGELHRVWTTTERLRPFIRQACQRIRQEAGRQESRLTGFFVDGLDIEQWLDEPQQVPSFAYLASSPLSYPLIYLTQIVNYLSLFSQGFERRQLLQACRGATGFSTGIMAALLTSLDVSFDEFIERALVLQELFVRIGLQVQRCTFGQGVVVELEPLQQSRPLGRKSCMARVDGLLRRQLVEAIADFDSRGRISMAYVLTPSRIVIAGMPDELEAFRCFLLDREALGPERASWKWQYILSTTAAHSPYHHAALEHLLGEVDEFDERLGFRGDTLHHAVYAIGDGSDLRQSSDILAAALKGILVDCGDWRRQLRSFFVEAPPTSVVDFGPGNGIAGLTASHLANQAVSMFRCAVPIGRTQLRRTIGQLPAEG